MSRTTEPTYITQGERFVWTKTIDDYSAALYTLVYLFRSNVGPGFNITAVADGADFDAEITAAISLVPKPGKYTWQAWLTEIATTTNTFIVGSGETMVKIGFAADPTSAVDMRSKAKIMLDTLDAALLAAGSGDMIEYEISTPAGSRRVKREARSTVLEQRKYWVGIVARENAMERVRRGGRFNKTVAARLNNA